MRRKRLWALLLLLLMVVAGCTGTVEEVPETLLVVGFTSENRGRLALIENNVLQDRTLRWLGDSVRDLPGLPLAADVVDRAGGREALVVLSRNSAGVSYLSAFNLRNLAPDRLEGFAETARIALNDPALPLPGPQPTALCPTRLQVSRDGRFAAILNEPAACAAPGPTSIAVLDLELPRFVRHYEGLAPLVANALTLDQADDVLYFLEETAGEVQLHSLALDPVRPPVRIGVAALDAREVQDMGIVRDSMVVLGESRFVAFENYRDDGDAPAPVTTSPHSRHLITSDFADILQVVILGRDDFTVHLSVTDPANRASLHDYQSGTVEALNGLVFLMGSRRVAVFDLVTYREGIPELITIPLAELTEPAFVSWVAALAPPP